MSVWRPDPHVAGAEYARQVDLALRVLRRQEPGAAVVSFHVEGTGQLLTATCLAARVRWLVGVIDTPPPVDCADFARAPRPLALTGLGWRPMGGRSGGGWRLGPVPAHGRSLTTFAGRLTRSLMVFSFSLAVVDIRLLVAQDDPAVGDVDVP